MKILVGARALDALSAWMDTLTYFEVCVTSNCCEELLSMISHKCARVNLIDIGDDRNMSLGLLEQILISSQNPDKILVISIWSYGVMPELDRLHALKRMYGFQLLEDRCLARPLLLDECGYLASQSDGYLFSTGYSKYCDVHYGGWLVEPSSNNELINICDIDIEEYFQSVAKRRFIVDLRKSEINQALLEHVRQIAINDWLAYQWRISFEVEDSILFQQIVNSNSTYCSNHYSDFCIETESSLPNTIAHKLHVVNIFNDLRVDQEYIKKIIKSIRCYNDVVRHPCKIRQQKNSE